MITFKQNKNLKLVKVTTKSGEIEYKINCRKIKKDYYVKDIECVIIGGTWYRKESSLIFFDNEDKEWKLIKDSKNIIAGIIGFDKDKMPILGKYTENPLINCGVIYKGNFINLRSLDLIQSDMKYIEDISRGNYIIEPSPQQIRSSKCIKNLLNIDNQPYNIEDDQINFDKMINVYNKNNIDIPKEIARYSKLLGNITYGVEIETIRGYIPNHIQYQNGVIICRDGSLKDKNDGTQGSEFTTIPLAGAKGLTTLKNLCRELKERTQIDNQCSLHVHIGNIPKDKNYLSALYKLCFDIQDDVFKMFPYYKNNEVEYAGKNKNYCQKLKNINKFTINKNVNKEIYLEKIYFNNQSIFSFLTEGFYSSRKYNKNNMQHPKNAKWDRHARYYWVNLMNVIFSKRQTVEFRIHQGTTNFTKIFTWLFMCNAILKFAYKNTYEILNGKKFTFKDVLNYYRSVNRDGVIMSEYLIEYYENMSNIFLSEASKMDYLGANDLHNDKNFKVENTYLNKIFN